MIGNHQKNFLAYALFLSFTTIYAQDDCSNYTSSLVRQKCEAAQKLSDQLIKEKSHAFSNEFSKRQADSQTEVALKTEQLRKTLKEYQENAGMESWQKALQPKPPQAPKNTLETSSNSEGSEENEAPISTTPPPPPPPVSSPSMKPSTGYLPIVPVAPSENSTGGQKGTKYY